MSGALDLLYALRLESGKTWGDCAADFQKRDAEAVLSSEPPNLTFLTRSRGGSKTTDLAAFVLVAMLTQLPPEARCYAYAADQSQAALLLDAINGFCARTPQLTGAIEILEWKVRAVANGVTLEAESADAASAWGKRPAFVVVDELAQWGSGRKQKALWEAITTAIPKTSGAKLAVITTSGDPVHWSRGVLDHAKASDAWYVDEVSGPAPWLSETDLAEQQALHTENTFRRLFHNEWLASEDRLADPSAIEECAVLDGPLPYESRFQYWIGLDVGYRRDASAAVVAHGEPLRDTHGRMSGTRVVVDRIQAWKPGRLRAVDLHEVQAWVENACHEYRARLRYDPSQAALMAQGFKAKGLRIEPYNATSSRNAVLVNVLYSLIEARTLALPRDEALLEELKNVRVRETPAGTLRIDHEAGGHDDRVVALAIAASRIIERPVIRPSRNSSPYISRGTTRQPGRGMPRSPNAVPSYLSQGQQWAELSSRLNLRSSRSGQTRPPKDGGI